MIIGIDASRSRHPRPTGVERYSTEIIRALLEVEALKDAEFRLYSPARLSDFSDAIQRVIPFPRLWTILRLSFEMLTRKPDVLFVPAYGLPFFTPKRSFVTIHDVAFRKFPGVYGWFQRFILNATTQRALRVAEAVFVPSQAVADDVQKFYSNVRAEVRVVPHGPLHLAVGGSLPKGLTTGSYLLFVGRLEAKKNLDRLIAAWRTLRTEFPDLQLALAGRKNPAWVCPNDDGLHELGFCDEATIHALLTHARALILPSLDEGFGFPLLQGFEAGCPVLCSKIPALEEVGGDAILSFDPESTEDMSRVIREFLHDDPAQQIARGHARLQQFSWSKAADAIASVFLKNPVK